MNSRIVISVALVATCLGMLFATTFYSKEEPIAELKLLSAFSFPVKKALSNFRFIDHNNEPFTKENFTDKWSLVFFGFTFCPDICPTTLSILNNVYSELPESIKDQLQVILVSVDPERDSVEKLAEYINFFNQDFLALATNQRDLIKLTQSLGVSFMKRKTDDPGGYTVDHTARIFLIDNKGRRSAMLNPESTQNIASFKPETLLADITTLMTAAKSNNK